MILCSKWLEMFYALSFYVTIGKIPPGGIPHSDREGNVCLDKIPRRVSRGHDINCFVASVSYPD